MREGEEITNKWFLLFEAAFYMGEKKKKKKKEVHVVFLCLFILWTISVGVDDGNGTASFLEDPE